MCLLWVWTSAHACAMSMLITLCMEDSPDCFCLHRCLTYLPWSGFIEAGLLTGLELLTSFHSLLDGNSCCPSPFTAQWLRKDSRKHLLQKWICRNSYLHSKIKLKLVKIPSESVNWEVCKVVYKSESKYSGATCVRSGMSSINCYLLFNHLCIVIQMSATNSYFHYRLMCQFVSRWIIRSLIIYIIRNIKKCTAVLLS